MISCINVTKDIKELANNMNMTTSQLTSSIKKWQKENNSEEIPSQEVLTDFLNLRGESKRIFASKLAYSIVNMAYSKFDNKEENTAYTEFDDGNSDQAVSFVKKMKPLFGEDLSIIGREDMSVKIIVRKPLYNIKTKEDILREIEEEENNIISEAKKNNTYLKAPNGKNTNLTPKLWVQVRTKAFKNWFGDWENDSENASKVVDENGEPLVVYHNSEEQFNVFSYEKINPESGFFFTSDPKYASQYGKEQYAVFLNVRNPIDAGEIRLNRETTADLYITNAQKVYKSKSGKYADGIIGNDSLQDEIVPSKGWEINVIHSNQIKSATDNIGTYSTEDNRIDRFTEEEFKTYEQREAKKIFFRDVYNKYLSSYDINRINKALEKLSSSIGDVPWHLRLSKNGNYYIAGYKNGNVLFNTYSSPNWRYVDRYTDSSNFYTQEELDYLTKQDLEITENISGNPLESVNQFLSKVSKIVNSSKYNSYKQTASKPKDVKQETEYKKYIRELSNNILSKLEERGMKINFIPNSNLNTTMAIYTKGKSINIDYNPKLVMMESKRIDYIIAHELVHSVTSQAVNNVFNNKGNKEEEKFVSDIRDIITELNNNKSFHISFPNIDINNLEESATYIKEFIANVMTDKDIMTALANIQVDKESLWNRFVKVIKNIVEKFIGKSVNNSYLNKIMDTVFLHIENDKNKNNLSIRDNFSEDINNTSSIDYLKSDKPLNIEVIEEEVTTNSKVVASTPINPEVILENNIIQGISDVDTGFASRIIANLFAGYLTDILGYGEVRTPESTYNYLFGEVIGPKMLEELGSSLFGKEINTVFRRLSDALYKITKEKYSTGKIIENFFLKAIKDDIGWLADKEDSTDENRAFWASVWDNFDSNERFKLRYSQEIQQNFGITINGDIITNEELEDSMSITNNEDNKGKDIIQPDAYTINHKDTLSSNIKLFLACISSNEGSKYGVNIKTGYKTLYDKLISLLREAPNQEIAQSILEKESEANPWIKQILELLTTNTYLKNQFYQAFHLQETLHQMINTSYEKENLIIANKGGDTKIIKNAMFDYFDRVYGNTITKELKEKLVRSVNERNKTDVNFIEDKKITKEDIERIMPSTKFTDLINNTFIIELQNELNLLGIDLDVTDISEILTESINKVYTKGTPLFDVLTSINRLKGLKGSKLDTTLEGKKLSAILNTIVTQATLGGKVDTYSYENGKGRYTYNNPSWISTIKGMIKSVENIPVGATVKSSKEWKNFSDWVNRMYVTDNNLKSSKKGFIFELLDNLFGDVLTGEADDFHIKNRKRFEMVNQIHRNNVGYDETGEIGDIINQLINFFNFDRKNSLYANYVMPMYGDKRVQDFVTLTKYNEDEVISQLVELAKQDIKIQKTNKLLNLQGKSILSAPRASRFNFVPILNKYLENNEYIKDSAGNNLEVKSTIINWNGVDYKINSDLQIFSTITGEEVFNREEDSKERIKVLNRANILFRNMLVKANDLTFDFTEEDTLIFNKQLAKILKQDLYDLAELEFKKLYKKGVFDISENIEKSSKAGINKVSLSFTNLSGINKFDSTVSYKISKTALKQERESTRASNEFNLIMNAKFTFSDFIFNSYAARANLIALTSSSTMFFKDTNDFYYRNSQAHTPGIHGMKDVRDEQGNLYAPDGTFHIVFLKGIDVKGRNSEFAKNTIELWDRKIKRMEDSNEDKNKIEAFKSAKKILLNKLDKGFDITDGQSLTSLNGRRKELGVTSKMTPELESLFRKLKSGDFNISDLFAMFQTEKSGLYTFEKLNTGIEENGFIQNVNTPVNIKHSEMLLIASMALAEEEIKLGDVKVIKNNIYSQLASFMDKNDIDFITFDSAVKIGKNNVIDITDKFAVNTSEIESTLESSIKDNPNTLHKYSVEDYGFQQEVPFSLMDEYKKFGTQLRKLVIEGLRGANTSFNVNGKVFTPEEFIQTYFELIAENVKSSANKLREELHIGEKYSKADTKSTILNKIRKNMIESGRYSLDDIESAIEIGLADPSFSDKIAPVLFSMIQGAVSDQKIAGGAAVLNSSFGVTDKCRIVYNKDGTVKHWEVLMAPRSQELLQAVRNDDGTYDINKKNILGERIISDGILEMIGFRIPTEALYSMAPLKVVGFLDPRQGSNIMLPSEVVFLSGSDFDIDKMFLMMKEYRKKTQKINLNKLAKDLRDKYNTRVITADDIRMELIRRHKGLQTFNRDKIDNILINISKEDLEKYIEDTTIEVTDDANLFAQQIFNDDKYFTVTSYEDIKYEEGEENPYSLERIRNKTTQQRNNLIVDMVKSVLINPDLVDSSNTPGNFDRIKEIAKEIAKLKRINISNMDIMNPISQSYFHALNNAAQKLIGTYANNSTGHSMGELLDVKIVSESAGHLKFDGINLAGLKFDSVYNKDGYPISLFIRELLAAAVDNRKMPILGICGWNDMTANIGMFLIRLGFDTRTISLFLSSNILEELYERYSSEKYLNNGYANLNKLISELGNELHPDFDSISKDMRKNDINENFDAKFFTEFSSDKDLKILALFSNLVPFGNDTNTYTLASKSDASTNAASGTVGHIVSLALRYNKVNSSLDGLSSFDFNENYLSSNLLINTFSTETFNLVTETSSEVLPYFSNTKLTDYNKVTNWFFNMNYNISDDFINILYRDLTAWKLSRIFSPNKETRDEVLNNITKDYNTLMKNHKDDLKVIGNPLLRKLVSRNVKMKRGDYIEMNIRSKGSEIDSDFNSVMKTAWAELLSLGEGYKDVQEFALKLMQYDFFRNCFKYSPKTSSSFIPTILKRNYTSSTGINYKDFLNKPDDMNDESSINIFNADFTQGLMENFLSQFFRHHSTDGRFVPKITVKNKKNIIIKDDSVSIVMDDSYSNIYTSNFGETTLKPFILITTPNSKNKILCSLVSPRNSSVEKGEIIQYTKVSPLGNNDIIEYTRLESNTESSLNGKNVSEEINYIPLQSQEEIIISKPAPVMTSKQMLAGVKSFTKTNDGLIIPKEEIDKVKQDKNLC